jgi:hypothetical protein
MWSFSTAHRSIATSLLAAALLCASAPARADNAGAAQQLYDRAVELMGQKKYAEACPKLEEVTRLVPDGFGAKLTLAECYEAQGRLASAWEQYSFVESAAARANQGERQRLAAERAAALKPKLAKLTIKVPEAVRKMPELVVKRGGNVIGPAQFDEAIPIDVGTHVIEATAHGKKPWSLETKIPADGASMTVEVPMLQDDPTQRLKQPPPSEGPSAEDKPTWLFPAGFAVGGVGVAALVAGGVLGGLAMTKNDDAEAECPNGFCTAAGNDLHVEAGTFADAATGLFVAGGVLAAGGILMIILAPTDDAPAEKPADEAGLHFRFAPVAGGVGLSADF